MSSSVTELHEKIALVNFVNHALAKDPLLTGRHIPLNVDSNDVYEKHDDGLILIKLVNFIKQGTIDEKFVNKAAKLNLDKKTENINYAIKGAKKLGCVMENIGSNDIIEGRSKIIMPLLWQIAKMKFVENISTDNVDPLIFDQEFLSEQSPPEKIILIWLNYHLRNSSYTDVVNNFDQDILNKPEIFLFILNQLNSKICLIKDFDNDRVFLSEYILSISRSHGVLTTHNANDIFNGNSIQMLGFLSQIYNTYYCLNIYEMTCKISLKDISNANELKYDIESEEEFLTITPNEILIRWCNRHLKKSNATIVLNRLESDLQPEVFCFILNQLNPVYFPLPDAALDNATKAAYLLTQLEGLDIRCFHPAAALCLDSDSGKYINNKALHLLLRIFHNRASISRFVATATASAPLSKQTPPAPPLKTSPVRTARSPSGISTTASNKSNKCPPAQRSPSPTRKGQLSRKPVSAQPSHISAVDSPTTPSAARVVTYQPENSTCKHPLRVLQEVMQLRADMTRDRRWLHQNPELSFQEFDTARYVADKLRSYGIVDVFECVGKTGVVALIPGEAGAGPCVALRGDMDALPLQEEACGRDYSSARAGAMHACGHDGHMSGLLAAARILWAERASMRGSVKLLFQPAEEGYGGARLMVAEGVLEEGPLGPRVACVYGLHLWSYEPLGTVQCSLGPVMAASDKFCIEVRGRGGHGAAPQGTVDAIVGAAAVVNGLQSIIARNIDPLDSAVLTCGTIHGGFGYNIIADKVTIVGTTRSFRKPIQQLLESRMRQVCCGVATMNGGEVDLDYQYGYPPTDNAYPECVAAVNSASAQIVGQENCGKKQLTMGAEDFSYFLLERPGCFFFVGAALPGEQRPHHKSVFDFDEDAMLVGASILVQIVRDMLSKR